MKTLSTMPTVKLTSGLTVGNFSRPHAFNFDDGSKLPACDADRVRAGTLKVREEVIKRNTRYTTLSVNHELTDSALDMLIESAYQHGVDLVIVPRVVIDASVNFIKMNRIRRDHELFKSVKKCVTIRMKDRLNKIAFHNRFCVGGV